MEHVTDSVGMHIFKCDKGMPVLKWTPANDTVWPGKVMGFHGSQIDDLHEAIAEVQQLRIINGLVESNPKFIQAVTSNDPEQPGLFD